ncbi:MAG: glycosyltransferase, partial [Leptospiraceae bacterium]|nr:glycosyltransferase [Leptospiraceae bacterium]
MSIAYIVNMKEGLEAFIFREIVELKKMGQHIDLYATKFTHKDYYSSLPNWYVNKLNLFYILPSAILTLIYQPQAFIGLLLLAIRYNVLIEFLSACQFSVFIRIRKNSNIHCHFGDKKLFIGFFCKKLTGKTLTATIHAHEIYANPNKRFFTHIIQHVDEIISISDTNKRILEEEYSVDSRKVVVIRLSVDIELFKKKNRIYVLTVARFVEGKGFRELFEAIKILNNPDLHFIVIG